MNTWLNNTDIEKDPPSPPPIQCDLFQLQSDLQVLRKGETKERPPSWKVARGVWVCVGVWMRVGVSV